MTGLWRLTFVQTDDRLHEDACVHARHDTTLGKGEQQALHIALNMQPAFPHAICLIVPTTMQANV